jgi:hypothetical protein
MRRFGIHESDLAVDFAAANEAVLVTRILEHCASDQAGGAHADFFRALTVGRRLERLLTLVAQSESSTFTFPFHCAACNEHIELELTLDELRELQQQADAIETVVVEHDGQSLEFRKPCGRDQELWGGMSFADRTQALRVMVGALARKPEAASALDTHLIDRVDEALDAADPLVNFHCRITCAECGTSNELAVDLCGAALAALRRIQRQLIDMVHRLASRYHWSEQEIFAVPHWRRQEYLELIAAGA